MDNDWEIRCEKLSQDIKILKIINLLEKYKVYCTLKMAKEIYDICIEKF
jgi:hypothetical protein